MYRKINKASKLSSWSAYPATWSAIIETIPDAVIQALTSKQLVALIDANQKIYDAGKTYNQREIDDFLGFDFWGVDWSQVDIDTFPQKGKTHA